MRNVAIACLAVLMMTACSKDDKTTAATKEIVEGAKVTAGGVSDLAVAVKERAKTVAQDGNFSEVVKGATDKAVDATKSGVEKFGDVVKNSADKAREVAHEATAKK